MADRGPGVPAELRDRIFDRFAHGTPSGASTRRQRPGAGDRARGGRGARRHGARRRRRGRRRRVHRAAAARAPIRTPGRRCSSAGQAGRSSTRRRPQGSPVHVIRKLVRRPSPATVIASLALFVSLSGVSYGVATGFIDSREIRNETIVSRDIKNSTVRTQDLRNNEIRGDRRPQQHDHRPRRGAEHPRRPGHRRVQAGEGGRRRHARRRGLRRLRAPGRHGLRSDPRRQRVTRARVQRGPAGLRAPAGGREQ